MNRHCAPFILAALIVAAPALATTPIAASPAAVRGLWVTEGSTCATTDAAARLRIDSTLITRADMLSRVDHVRNHNRTSFVIALDNFRGQTPLGTSMLSVRLTANNRRMTIVETPTDGTASPPSLPRHYVRCP